MNRTSIDPPADIEMSFEEEDILLASFNSKNDRPDKKRPAQVPSIEDQNEIKRPALEEPKAVAHAQIIAHHVVTEPEAASSAPTCGPQEQDKKRPAQEPSIEENEIKKPALEELNAVAHAQAITHSAEEANHKKRDRGDLEDSPFFSLRPAKAPLVETRFGRQAMPFLDNEQSQQLKDDANDSPKDMDN